MTVDTTLALVLIYATPNDSTLSIVNRGSIENMLNIVSFCTRETSFVLTASDNLDFMDASPSPGKTFDPTK